MNVKDELGQAIQKLIGIHQRISNEVTEEASEDVVYLWVGGACVSPHWFWVVEEEAWKPNGYCEIHPGELVAFTKDKPNPVSPKSNILTISVLPEGRFVV